MSPVLKYERLKAAWLAANPDATHDQYMIAMIELARKAGI